MELLRTAGVTAPDRMLGPLLGAALDNALRSGDAALTGPVARGDAGTVSAHVAQLRAHAPHTVAGDPRWPARPPTAPSPTACSSRNSPKTCSASSPTAPRCPRTGETNEPRLRTRPHPGDLRYDLQHASVPGRTAVVMTMGALHEGHATLIRTARELAGPNGDVVVTVFVNPLQFGAGEDLDRYPRTLDADVKPAGQSGADIVFAPSADEIYPDGRPEITLRAGPMGNAWRVPRGPATSTACSPSSPSCSTSPAPTSRSSGRRTPSSSP
ncbi:Pantothenate synthetase [Streptomyces glaucescens]